MSEYKYLDVEISTPSLHTNILTSCNAYSPQKGRFETRTHEAINKPTTERHLDLSANLQHPVHPNISSIYSDYLYTNNVKVYEISASNYLYSHIVLR